MALPKPLSQRPTGMPQMRRKSTLRTASANLQGAFLERVRAVRDDPLVLLPTAVGPEPRELAALRKGLEAAGRGKLGFFARRDKGVLGAAWSCRALADRKEVPRLLDARIDGERRFYLPTGHVRKTACLGVQNWDEPLALLLAYEGMAEAGLHFFAGRDLWCTGPSATLVADWVEDLAERAGADLTLDGAHARCPHADRAALAHVLPGGPEIRLCASCATDDFGTLLQARVRNPGGRRPYTLAVVLPDGTREAVATEPDALYRIGRATGATLIASALARWHGTRPHAYAIGDRLYATQDEFLDALAAPAWMRPALAAMTAPGHTGPAMTLADVLARHRSRLADGIRALGADPADVAARGVNSDEAALLRLAHDLAGRAAKTADLPRLPPSSGPLAVWIDGFVRLRREQGEAAALAKVRREAPRLAHKVHVAAFLAACGADPAVGTGFTYDQKEAALALAPLARQVLDAVGPAYVAALRAYLDQSGSGETLD
jgi:hypothetical protein